MPAASTMPCYLAVPLQTIVTTSLVCTLFYIVHSSTSWPWILGKMNAGIRMPFIQWITKGPVKGSVPEKSDIHPHFFPSIAHGRNKAKALCTLARLSNTHLRSLSLSTVNEQVWKLSTFSLPSPSTPNISSLPQQDSAPPFFCLQEK